MENGGSWASLLPAHPAKRSRRHMIQFFENLGNKRLKMFHTITEGLNDQNRNGECGQVLLELKPTIHR